MPEHIRKIIDALAAKERSLPSKPASEMDAAKTKWVSLELHTEEVCRQFNDAPVQQNFSHALAQLLLEAAQQWLIHLQQADDMSSFWRHTHPNVILFETLAYLWCETSFQVNETVRYAFDDDKHAVQRGTLDGLNRANAMIRNQWRGFSPETYALSRMLFYPKETALAAAHFVRLLEASEGRDFPLFPAELPNTHADKASNASPSAFAAHVSTLRTKMSSSVDKRIAALVQHYLHDRLDEPSDASPPFCATSW